MLLNLLQSLTLDQSTNWQEYALQKIASHVNWQSGIHNMEVCMSTGRAVVSGTTSVGQSPSLVKVVWYTIIALEHTSEWLLLIY